jgi:hypothetical protein
MVKLSVNVNKVATLRNSRGGREPSVVDAVRVCVGAGVPGITVHPRADARHITPADVREVAAELAPLKGRVEFNMEGDPRPEFMDLVTEVRPDQCTLVPVRPGEITSQAGGDTGRSRRWGRRRRCRSGNPRRMFVAGTNRFAGPGPPAPSVSAPAFARAFRVRRPGAPRRACACRRRRPPFSA